MEQTPLPRRIDDKPRLLFWTADEAVPFALLFMVGMVIGQFILCIVLGLGASWLFRKYRDRHPDGYVLHALYWYGVMPLRGRCLVNPFHRRILPS